MKALVQALPSARRKPQEPIIIYTTLYDLIASINEEVGPDEEQLITATVVHLLNTYQVTYTEQPLKGHRIICHGQARSARSRQQRQALFSQSERERHHFGRGKCKVKP
jgi:hypothetical protein